MRITRRGAMQGVGSAIAAGIAPRAAFAQQSLANLPATMVWSTYDVGSTGYVEASAIADALGKKYGTRVQPLKEKRASHAWLANELYFAVEGLYEYCAPDWGPQDLRVLMGRVNSFSVVATKVSGVKEPKDLKGKRFAIARANSSVNVKVEPILAFAGLTWKDVQLVEFPSYGATLKGLVEGRADCAGVAPNAAALRELEASPHGIGWVALDPANKEGWARAQKAVPFVEPFQETVGAGLTKDAPVWMMGYRYPMVTVPAATSADESYAMMQAVAESYALFKDANPIMPRWDIAKAGTPPMDAAFHDGAIRYLKEKGIWKPETQAWQDKTLKRHQTLQAAWKDMMEKDAKAKAAAAADLPAIWEPRREAVLKGLG